MVLNTQRTNIQKIRSIIDSNLNKAQTCIQVRSFKDKVLKDSLLASNQLQQKLQQDHDENERNMNQLNTLEQQLNVLRSKISNLDPMDYKSTKSVYDETMLMTKSLNSEFNTARHEKLDQSIRNSTVKIKFEKTDELLSTIQAEQDTIYMKLASDLTRDPGVIFLTTYMLANIFSEKISSHNVNYQDLIRRAQIDDGLDAPQPIDDVSDYIDFINHQLQSIQVCIILLNKSSIFYLRISNHIKISG